MKVKRIISHIFLAYFIFSVVSLLLCLSSPHLAYFLNFSVASYPRRFFAALSSAFGFSLFEILVLASPMLIAIAVIYIVRAGSVRDTKRRFVLLLSIGSLLPSNYVFMIAIPNLSPSPLFFDSSKVSEADIISSAKILAAGVNELCDEEHRNISYEILSRELTDSYYTALSEYGILSRKLPVAKPLIFSEVLSRTGALATYSPPTGEVNISSEIPSYMAPFSVAHEYAHLSGIGGEGDANVFAFVCCEGSKSPAIQYSARLTILEYLLSDLHEIDREMYINVYNSLDLQAVEDIKEHVEYSKRYESRAMFRLSEKLNFAHRKLWDKKNKRSYSSTTLRIVFYLKNNQ